MLSTVHLGMQIQDWGAPRPSDEYTTIIWLNEHNAMAMK